MDETLCNFCSGTGECTELVSDSPDSGEFIYSPCPACRGGLFSPMIRFPLKKDKSQNVLRLARAMRAALDAIEKHEKRSKK